MPSTAPSIVRRWTIWRWALLSVAAVSGGLGFALLSDAGTRAGLSYLGGLALVVGAFEFGSFNIRFTGKYLPSLTLVVAMLSYATTGIALALVLAASSPRVVDGAAIASGLFTGIVVWIGTEIMRTRVRS